MKKFNTEAIASFGARNSEMHFDSSCSDFGSRYGRLLTYLDVLTVKNLAIKRFPKERRSNLKIVDIGAGKGRMTCRLAKDLGHCVAIEPLQAFYNVLKKRCNLKNIETFNGTLLEYRKRTIGHFDIAWVSGVWPYLDDEELHDFILDIKKILSSDGILINRELASKNDVEIREDIMTISRPPHIIEQFGKKAGFHLEFYQNAYPPNLPRKLFQKWPNSLTKVLWNISNHKYTYPLWRFMAKLNINHSSLYMVYVFKKRKKIRK